MKKFILLLLIPFMMVVSSFAYELVGLESDYEDEDVTIEFIEQEDGTFRFVISNYTDETIFVNYEDSYYCALDEEFEEIKGTETPIFSEEEIMDDVDFIDAGNYLASEPYWFTGDVNLAGFYIAIEIDDEEYEWIAIVADFE